MKNVDDAKQPTAGALKQKFLQCFSRRASNTSMLRDTVKVLLDQGVTRQTMVDWAVWAGYSKGYASSLLSQILCSMGLRVNQVGGGRKPSMQALELLAHARGKYGKKFLNVLRAAWRAGKTQLAQEDSQTPDVAPQIQSLARIMVPQLSRTTGSGPQLRHSSVITNKGAFR